MVLLSIDFASLHTILESLYNEMMPLCEDMLGVAKGVAGLGALFYVALRVWQSMARAEPVDVYPLLRPFALGICILLFPTLVLGTMNSILSPIVQGTHRMLEGQTLDMQQYRAQKDRLEREAMMRNPETAYLVSDEEFDRQLDELGWSPGDAATRLGMYMEVGIPQPAGIALCSRFVADRYGTDLFPGGTFRAGSDSLLHFGVGRLAVHARAVVHKIYIGLPVASCQRPVQLHACQDTGAHASERYCRTAGKSRLFTGQFELRVHHFHVDRDCRLFYRSDRFRLDCPGGRWRQLFPQSEPYGD